MKPTQFLRHEFIDVIPKKLEQGVIYVSIKYATAGHACACGCGNLVITPITPTDWQLTYDGETISLHPSIGNWSFPCKSHYWIRQNRVQWAERWTQREIDQNRRHDRHVKERQFARQEESEPAPKRSLWDKLTRRFRS